MLVRAAASVLVACTMAVLTAPSAQAQSLKVLYSFAGGVDGADPYAGVIRDAKGNLYGTTLYGGNNGSGCSQGSCGVVFRVEPTGNETVLYSFTGGASDGASPTGGVIEDATGNLYGTTSLGGPVDAGTVFRVTKKGTETVLHIFTDEPDGANPEPGVIRDAEGNLFGTTCCGGLYAGTVFRVTKKGTETVLYSFTGRSDGWAPFGGLIRDDEGNLYGTTEQGGSRGCGVVFKLSKKDKETALYSFSGSVDGGWPTGGLIRDSGGTLYGTTALGGNGTCDAGYGTVFKLTKVGKETVLYSFTGGSDGSEPTGGLIRDSRGNLYGTTSFGGDTSCEPPYGCGTVFKLSKTGKETVLHTFTGGADGANPDAGMIQDSKGNFYGTTFYGGAYGYGTVFKLTRR
jgi:uncharacterized repeat protein (TIGR03803 family)